MTALTLDDPSAFAGSALVFINRCRARGIPAGETATGFILDACVGTSADMWGLHTRRSAEPAVPMRLPRIAIYCGGAIGYPYWGYYAHALLSIGLTFAPLSAADVSSGRLEGFDLLIIPGGFATWGLDRAERMTGIDAAIRTFVAEGGALIGSCGGAFYVSEGRPGWLGAIDAMPKFTQEYLLTGAAVLGVSIADPALRRGLPEAVELPYYHGPVYSNEPRSAKTLGRFRNFIGESRLFIDNPLRPLLFGSEMRGTPAILAGDYGKGKVLAFSPHPEMGEFLRKGIALDTYARHFLPIRGHKVLDETLQFFMKEDCPGFRLIYNAIAYLGLFQARDHMPAVEMTENANLLEALDRLDLALQQMFVHIDKQADAEGDAMRRLIAGECARTRQEWTDVRDGLRGEFAAGPVDGALARGLAAALNDAGQSLRSPARLAENLVLAELPIRLSAAALRLIRCDRTLEACP